MTVHLHVRSSFTLLSSTVRIPDLVRKAKEQGFSSIALTDHNVMHGTASFLHECGRYGVRPIIGLEADCLYHDDTVPFLLLARNNAGYRNLMRLSGLICSRNERRCTLDELREYSENCFLIAYGEGGWLDSQIMQNDRDEARTEMRSRIRTMKQELPEFDLAVSCQNYAVFAKGNSIMRAIAHSLGVRTVALSKIQYLEPEGYKDLEILLGIRDGMTAESGNIRVLQGRHLLSRAEMEKLYDAEDLRRAEEIASQCQADGKLPLTSLPQYISKSGEPASEYLPKLCLAGLQKRMNNNIPPGYLKRLKHELQIILKMHFEDYFLIVYDFINYARKQGISVGPGRGSAAGSLVSYCLGITQIDPLKYDLLFERFLNPERVTMPDIDTDFPDNRRAEVIDYVFRKYGEEHVCGVAAFGTLAAHQVIRDVCKVLNTPSREAEMLMKSVPDRPGMTLRQAYESSARMRQLIGSSDALKKVYDTALHLEGLPRNLTTHPAGIVMSGKPLSDVIPLMQVNEGMKTSQFSAGYLEERGLIKMDFLGLRNLTIIDDITRRIREQHPDFDISSIPLNDERAYRIFRNADTLGVFQFESDGMKNVLRKIRPDDFESMVAALALFRPASADSIPQYIQNRANPDGIAYPSEQLKPVLKSTYGVMIYQEQAMLTAVYAAGFSLGRADVLRKAMSKKNEKDLNSLKDSFLNGCLKNGYSQKTAEELFELVSRFAGYGFNKSHAVAYGMISYQMAYLKAVYPDAFYTSILDSVIGDSVKTAQYIDECRRRKICVLAPDVNESGKTYLRTEKGIILPLSAVRGVGYNLADQLLAEREERGPFTSFYDFTARAVLRKVPRNVIEYLIDAGALDGLGLNRRTMRASLDDALKFADLVVIRNSRMMTIDLGLVSEPVPVRMKEVPEEESELEKNALGFNLGTQPIVLIREKYRINTDVIAVIGEKRGMVRGFAVIRNVKQHRTKRGDMMAFVKVADETGEMDLAVMPTLYSRVSGDLVRGTYIMFDAKISDERSAIAETIRVVQKK